MLISMKKRISRHNGRSKCRQIWIIVDAYTRIQRFPCCGAMELINIDWMHLQIFGCWVVELKSYAWRPLHAWRTLMKISHILTQFRCCYRRICSNVLSFFKSNKEKIFEQSAHHLLFLLYPFWNESELKIEGCYWYYQWELGHTER